MTDSRTEILRRIHHALGTPTTTPPDPTTIPRHYLTTHTHHTPHQRTQLLDHNLTDYRAHTHHTDTPGLPATIAHLLTDHHSTTAVVPPGLPPQWLTHITDIDIHHDTDTHPLTAHQLDHIDTAITACTLAIAETGTIILDTSPDQGRRILTLVPDHHICIIDTSTQIVDSLPQAIPHLDPTRPLTWISGPSATSDIELQRVEGVHGPRTLDVILLNPTPQNA